MTYRISTRGGLLLFAVLPLFATGCGGDGSTGSGIFGGTGQSVATQAATPATGLTPSAASGSLTPNTAPVGGKSGAATEQASPKAATSNGSLAPVSGTYAGTWTPVASATEGGKDAAPAKSAPTTGGALTLKISYPKHPSKTVLGDVSGAWVEPALGGVGRLSGTIDRIGLPREPNAVHVVGNITFPGGKSRPFAVELAEETVGHLGGSTTDAIISLKKTR